MDASINDSLLFGRQWLRSMLRSSQRGRNRRAGSGHSPAFEVGARPGLDSTGWDSLPPARQMARSGSTPPGPGGRAGGTRADQGTPSSGRQDSTDSGVTCDEGCGLRHGCRLPSQSPCRRCGGAWRPPNGWHAGLGEGEIQRLEKDGLGGHPHAARGIRAVGFTGAIRKRDRRLPGGSRLGLDEPGTLLDSGAAAARQHEQSESAEQGDRGLGNGGDFDAVHVVLVGSVTGAPEQGVGVGVADVRVDR